MTAFSKLYSNYWINHDNTEIIDAGIDGQLMALYLQGNSHHNMLGVYYLPLLYISSDLRLSVKRVRTILDKLSKINYCKYDPKTQYVWVCNLASEQTGKIDIKDNRIKAIQGIWKSLPSKLDFLEEIYQKYHTTFYLELRPFIKKPKPETNKEIVIENKTNKEIATEETTKEIAKKEVITKTVSSQSEPIVFDMLSLKDIRGLPDSDVKSTTDNSPITLLKSKSLNILFDDSIVTDVTKNPPENQIVNDVLTGSLEYQVVLPIEGISNRIQFEAPSDPLQSPIKGALTHLRSNIEDRSKNIEERINKKDIETKKEEIQTIAPQTHMVVQARQFLNKNPVNRDFSFENTQRTPFARSSNGFPITATNQKPTPKRTAYFGKDTRDITTIFEHWKFVMNHPEAVLDGHRVFWIRNGLKKFGVEKLCMAITGVLNTAFYNGDNKQGQRYDSLHVIFSNAHRIEMFIKNCRSPPKPKNEYLAPINTWAGEKLSGCRITENKYV